MKKYFKIFAVFSVLIFAFDAAFAFVKVACVGDSITYGSGIKDRGRDSYPAQLGKILGGDYKVENFGVGGATLLSKGDKPYVTTYAYVPALRFMPDIVIIKLGTNDSKPFNWFFRADFERDLNDLIDSFANLPSRPEIYLCRQAPAFEKKWGIDDAVISGEVFPIVEKVAKARGIKIIDMRTPLEHKANLFPDKIHPNPEGAGIMAKTAAAAIFKK